MYVCMLDEALVRGVESTYRIILEKVFVYVYTWMGEDIYVRMYVAT